MARKLKTYQTSLGFFDLAVAAPSMKAALEAWGASSNLFHQGAAKEADDPAVVAAAMSKPGIVLKRPVGTRAPFREHAELPSDIASDAPSAKSRKPRKANSHRAAASPKLDKAQTRAAAAAYEKAERERERRRRKEEAAEAKASARREQAVAKAKGALDKARSEHEERMRELDAQRAALEERSQVEEARWSEQKRKLESLLRRARE